MAFPTDLSELEDNVDDVLAAHVNALEEKVGIDGSSDTDSLDYKVRYPPGQVKSLVYLGTNQENITDNSSVLVNFDTEVYDPLNCFNTTTHKFTCPVAGDYLVIASLGLTGVTANQEYGLSIKLEGVEKAFGYTHSASTGDLGLFRSTILHCAATDEITCYVYFLCGVNTTDILGEIQKSYFQIHLLSTG
jgi:hypothetical protein